MNRLISITAACALAACSSSPPDKVTIKLFQAAPDAIELGQSTKLLFVVDPATAEVSIDTLGDQTGKTQVMVSPSATTTYHLLATNGAATADNTVTVTVGPQAAVALKLEPQSATTIAGNAVPVTVTAIAASGKPAPGFRGTVHLTSSDAKAGLPADLVFTASDAGVKLATVTLRAAGTTSLTGADTANPVTQGTTSVTVAAAAATSCTASQAPAATVAGSVIGVIVALHDTFGNVATGYTGTMSLTTSDVRALLPPSATYVPASDAGSHAFSAVLLTTGSQALTATDSVNATIHCSAAVMVTPAAPKLVLAIPANANAGYPVTVGVMAKDLFDNAIPNYAATVTFTSSDTGALPPAPITFAGTEGGVGNTSATFVTLGAQTIAASDNGTPVAIGNAASLVHGLVYTGPNTGRVRLVANPAQSTTQIVQLDLVANERLEVSSFFGGGPGSFAAGMNLPLDTNRAGADATLFTPGNALPLGTGTPAAIGRIGATDQTLYVGVSRKRVAGPIFAQETEVAAGRVFFSVRLRLQPTALVGSVFDGAQPSPLFRAAVRDQYGDDFVNQGDFGIGKLEVR